jgi:glutamine amidotransferase PdxT
MSLRHFLLFISFSQEKFIKALLIILHNIFQIVFIKAPCILKLLNKSVILVTFSTNVNI